jgi:hypothetical protein
MLARIHAAWLLALSLLRTIARRLFRPNSHGLALFYSNYAQDRLLPLTTADRDVLPTFSGCVACGLCDVGQAASIAGSQGRYRGMMAFVLSASRSMPDFNAAVDALRHVDVAKLESLERVCPSRVPLRSIVAFVRRKAADVS